MLCQPFGHLFGFALGFPLAPLAWGLAYVNMHLFLSFSHLPNFQPYLAIIIPTFQPSMLPYTTIYWRYWTNLTCIFQFPMLNTSRVFQIYQSISFLHFSTKSLSPFTMLGLAFNFEISPVLSIRLGLLVAPLPLPEFTERCDSSKSSIVHHNACLGHTMRIHEHA